jgi:predicted transcriptional regulator of viral defense system
MEAALWPSVGTAVVSHESALALYGLSDVDPARIHITIPTSQRVRRSIPRRLALHWADLSEEDTTAYGGIPVTTVARTLRDCRAAALGDEVLTRALLQAEREGWIGRAEGERLRSELGLSAP